MYANGWPSKGNTPESIAEGVKQVVDQGYTALKFYPFRGEQVAKIDRIEHGVALVEAARETAGPQVEIGIDIRARLNIWSARRVAQALEPYNIAWMEEPILWDNPEALAQFAHEVRVPIATGEQLYTRWGFPIPIRTERRGHHPAGHLSRGRHHRTKKNSGNGRNLLRNRSTP